MGWLPMIMASAFVGGVLGQVPMTQLLVANGGGGAETSVEVLNLSDPTSICAKPADYPFYSHGTSGTFIGGAPLICGGSGTAEGQCAVYDPAADAWDVDSGVSITETSRYFAGDVRMSEETWMLLGGETIDSLTPLDSIEVFTEGDGFYYYGALPRHLYGVNALRLNASHLFVVNGQERQGSDPANVWIHEYGTETWIQMEERTEGLVEAAAGVVTKEDGTKEIVTAGGFPRTSKTEIFSLETLQWRSGPDLPIETYGCSSVQYEDTFLVVGGADSDQIFKYDQYSEAWELWPQRLSTVRKWSAAFLVPEGYFECN